MRIFDCRVGGRPAALAFGFHGGSAPVAFDIHLEDRCVMNKPIDRGEGHGGIRKDAVPFSKGLIGGDHDGAPLISCADEFEEHARFGLVLGDVGQIVEDEQIELVELCDGGFELELPPRDLKLLDEIGRAGEQHAPAVLDQGEADGRGEMALSAAGRPKQQDIGTLCEPAVAGGHGHDLRLGDHGYGVEGEAVEGLAGRQVRLGEVSFYPAMRTLGQFVLGNGRQEPGGGPSLSIGLFGELRPERLDCRQPELVEHDAETGFVDDVGGLHATSPT